VHSRTTAAEVLADFPEGLDYLITGVGTGGHFTGVSRILKEKWPSMKAFAVEPEASPVISGGSPGPHPIQGIGAGFIPENLDMKLIDRVITVSKEEAFEYAREAAKKEGLFVGISSGASLSAIAKIQNELKGSRILTFAYDTGERYLSVDGLF
jgi:cysteine synthase A